MGQAAWEKGQLSVLHFVSFFGHVFTPSSGILLLPSGTLSTNPILQEGSPRLPGTFGPGLAHLKCGLLPGPDLR